MKRNLTAITEAFDGKWKPIAERCLNGSSAVHEALLHVMKKKKPDMACVFDEVRNPHLACNETVRPVMKQLYEADLTNEQHDAMMYLFGTVLRPESVLTGNVDTPIHLPVHEAFECCRELMEYCPLLETVNQYACCADYSLEATEESKVECEKYMHAKYAVLLLIPAVTGCPDSVRGLVECIKSSTTTNADLTSAFIAAVTENKYNDLEVTPNVISELQTLLAEPMLCDENMRVLLQEVYGATNAQVAWLRGFMDCAEPNAVKLYTSDDRFEVTTGRTNKLTSNSIKSLFIKKHGKEFKFNVDVFIEANPKLHGAEHSRQLSNNALYYYPAVEAYPNGRVES